MPEATAITDDALADAMSADALQPVADQDQPPAAAAYAPNVDRLANARGDAGVWASELSELIGHTTGKWISEETLLSWLDTLTTQVRAATYRAALFQVANTKLPSYQAGDPAVLMLQLRDDIAGGFRHAAGL